MTYMPFLLLLLLASCGGPVFSSPAGPPSLQIVPPEYYSRTLNYTVHRRYRGREISHTYQIPVRVYRETGEVEIQGDHKKQFEVIQNRINGLRNTLESVE